MPSSQQIRQQFIDFFAGKYGHTHVPSSPVVPHDDPTLLFANAGMNQFKDVFLGTGHRPYRRAVNSQKCIRAGGKHNDLEDVGKDTYHHTFFEMLGNWSFGDYYKEEAIRWAWELLTEVWGLEKRRLHATVFEGDAELELEADTEAAELWKTVTDIDHAHVHRGSREDNFWEMGETGPCGPCSEIHIDLTPDYTGGPLVNAGDARVIEIWNLVFIGFNRNASGRLTPLPAKHVDTGMGFERLCAVLQGKPSNYDIDLFTGLFEAIAEVSGARPYGGALGDPIDMAYRVIADHARCLTVALADGAVPGNEGRGYVLRRILRRAVRFGWQTLGMHEPFLHRLVSPVIDSFGGAFEALAEKQERVEAIIHEEEAAFSRTLDRGFALFEQAVERARHKRIGAEDAFQLHDTFGFPVDLTALMAEERGMSVDLAGFNRLMESARAQARAGGGGGTAHEREGLGVLLQEHASGAAPVPGTVFEGYARTEWRGAATLSLVRFEETGPAWTERLEAGARGAVVVGRTPFYSEAGGQVGDTGIIEAGETRFRVEETIRVGEAVFHLGAVEAGVLEAGETEALRLAVDAPRRALIEANHTGTHLLNWALRDVLGDHVEQRGSHVDGQRLRFDFSHGEAIEAAGVEAIEARANEQVEADHTVYAGVVPLETARSVYSLRAVFGEKYGEEVRVISIGVPVEDLVADPENRRWRDYSIELCGGTHKPRSGEVVGLVVTGEESVSRGVRRITALTGEAAAEARAEGERLAREAALLQAAPDDEQLADRVAELERGLSDATLPLAERERLRAIEGELKRRLHRLERERSEAAAGSAAETASALAEAGDAALVVGSLGAVDKSALRMGMDVVRRKRPEAAVLLGAEHEGKVIFVAAVPETLIERGLKAGDWVREVARVSGGGGGGRPEKAEAGGKDPARLEEALARGREVAEQVMKEA